MKYINKNNRDLHAPSKESHAPYGTSTTPGLWTCLSESVFVCLFVCVCVCVWEGKRGVSRFVLFGG